MSIKKQIISLSIIPLILMALAVGTISVIVSENYINQEIRSTLKVAVLSYSGDVSQFKSEGIDLTVFTGDTRTASSIDGVLGTQASAVVIETVLNGQEEYFDTNVSVNGLPYYGYYIPTADGMLFAGKPRAEVIQNINHYIQIVTGICLVCFLLISVVALLISRKMSKSIQGTASNMQLLADGSLSQIEKTKAKTGAAARKNEINAMVNATNSLVERLADVIDSVKKTGSSVNQVSAELGSAVEAVLSSSGEVSKAVEDIASGAVSQNDSTEAMIENLHNVSGNVRTIQGAVTDINSYVDEMNACKQSVNTSIDSLTSSSEATNVSVEKIRVQIGKTHDQVDKIENIVNVIEEIAAETKMLSLNASIEAARAGEAGRGFAVVADTINSLSENVTTQVQEINGLVIELVTDFSQCEVDISSVVENNQTQASEIEAVIHQFSELQTSIDNTVNRIETISQSISHVADECDAVLLSAQSLNQISEANVASTQEVNANIQELNAMITQIDENAKGLADKSDDLSQHLQFFH